MHKMGPKKMDCKCLSYSLTSYALHNPHTIPHAVMIVRDVTFLMKICMPSMLNMFVSVFKN